MVTFDDIRKEIKRKHGYFAAKDYEESYERDNHWKRDRVYSQYDAEDGADYPVTQYARRAYNSLR